jgi:hypothetical protein
VRNFSVLDRPHLSPLKRNDCDRFAVQCNELYFVCPPAAVHMHHRADIARGEFFGRKISYQYYTVMLSYWTHFDSCNG